MEQVETGCEREVSNNLEVRWGAIIKGFHFEAEITPNPSVSLRRRHKHHVIILVYRVAVPNVPGSFSATREQGMGELPFSIT